MDAAPVRAPRSALHNLSSAAFHTWLTGSMRQPELAGQEKLTKQTAHYLEPI